MSRKLPQNDLATQRKIVFFLSSMTHGGAERVALLLSTAMSTLGHKVYLVLARKEGGFIDLVPQPVEIISLDCGRPIRGTLELGQVIKRLDPDVVIAFGIHAGIAASLSKMRTRWDAPIIIRNESNLSSEWMHERLHNRLIGPALSKFAANKSTVVCVSNSLRHPTANFLGADDDDIEVIQNPVFPSLEIPSVEQHLHPWLERKTAPTFVAVGRLEPQKDFTTLLKAFRLARDRTECRLVIFGDGSLRGTLEMLRNTLDLGDSVDLPGVTNSPMLQMRHATAFILSSRWEGFGLVLVEALAAGTMVISTNCDYGPAEILEQGHYGTLVPVSDEIAMANAIVDVALNGGVKTRPPADWYGQFDARTAALKHLAIVERFASTR